MQIVLNRVIHRILLPYLDTGEPLIELIYPYKQG